MTLITFYRQPQIVPPARRRDTHRSLSKIQHVPFKRIFTQVNLSTTPITSVNNNYSILQLVENIKNQLAFPLQTTHPLPRHLIHVVARQDIETRPNRLPTFQTRYVSPHPHTRASAAQQTCQPLRTWRATTASAYFTAVPATRLFMSHIS